jgi:hypothetical protein
MNRLREDSLLSMKRKRGGLRLGGDDMLVERGMLDEVESVLRMVEMISVWEREGIGQFKRRQ